MHLPVSVRKVIKHFTDVLTEEGVNKLVKIGE